MAGAIACALALSACGSVEPAAPQPAPDSEAAGAPAPAGASPALTPVPTSSPAQGQRRPRPGHGQPIPQDIEILWDERAETFRAGALSATLLNNTDRALVVRLSAESTDPHGEITARELGEQRVAPRASEPIDVSFDRLPLQTAGVSSGLRLVAQFEITTARVDGSAEVVTHTLSRVVAATTVHLTFDADFRMATVRSIAAQAAANATRSSDEPAARPTAMRAFDQEGDALRDVDMSAPDMSDKPIVGFVDLPADAFPGISQLAPQGALKGAVP